MTVLACTLAHQCHWRSGSTGSGFGSAPQSLQHPGEDIGTRTFLTDSVLILHRVDLIFLSAYSMKISALSNIPLLLRSLCKADAQFFVSPVP